MGDMHKHHVNPTPDPEHTPAGLAEPDAGRGAAPGSLAAALAGLRRPRPTPAGVEDADPDEETRPRR